MSTNSSLWPVPSPWSWASFGDVAEIAQNLVDPLSVPDMPHIAPNNIGSADRRLLPYTTVRQDGVISPKQRFKPGQILFTKIRPYLLKSIKVDFEGVCSADMYPLWANDAIEADFLLYWLTSPDFRAVIAHHQGRTVLPKINQSALNATPVPVPPAKEQRRIVSKIDSLSAKSRTARSHLDHATKLVAHYRKAILHAAFQGNLMSIWRESKALPRPVLKTVGELVTELRYGTAQKCQAENTGIAVLRIPNVSSGSIDMSDLKYANLDESEHNKLKLIEGDILVIRSNGSPGLVGRAAMVSGEAVGMAYAGYLIRLRPKQALILPKFLSLMLEAPQLRKVIEVGARSTSGVHNINSNELAALVMPLPSLLEQDETVRRIEAAFRFIGRLAAETTSVRRLIDHLDQAVLSKAFRGELVPQDPDDEPASVLLERIKGEKCGTTQSRRGRGRPKVVTG